MTAPQALDAIRSQFIEKVGLITQAEGLPRIAGRVFGLLIFDGEAVAFGALAQDLRVSRGSVSSSVRLLEERGLIRRLTRTGERQDYFQLAADPYVSMLNGVRRRTLNARAEIEQIIDALPDGAGPAHRLRDYARFFTCIDAGLAMAVAELVTTAPAKDTPHDV